MNWHVYQKELGSLDVANKFCQLALALVCASSSCKLWTDDLNHGRPHRFTVLSSRNERKASRTGSPRGRSPSVRMSRWPCKDYFKGTCTNSFCKKWHPPECFFYKSESGCRFVEKCFYAHRHVEEQSSKRSNKNGDRSAVAVLKSTRKLGCVFHDLEPPKSTTIFYGRAQT